MAYTFLQAINAALKDAQIIQGSSGELTTFTDSARQTEIDVMISSWNDVISELGRVGVLKGETSTGTITLVTGTREYSLAADFEKMAGDPVDSTNKNRLYPYPGGFDRMRLDQLDPDDFEGLPRQWAINHTNGKLRVDRNPTASENGAQYTYVYEKTQNLSATTDSFPFSDDAVDALRDAAVQVFNRKRKNQFDQSLFQRSLARAAGYVRQKGRRTHYGARRAAS